MLRRLLVMLGMVMLATGCTPAPSLPAVPAIPPEPPVVPAGPRLVPAWESALRELGWEGSGTYLYALEASFRPGDQEFLWLRLEYLQDAPGGVRRLVIRVDQDGTQGEVSPAGPAFPTHARALAMAFPEVAGCLLSLDRAGVAGRAVATGEFSVLEVAAHHDPGRVYGLDPAWTYYVVEGTGVRPVAASHPVAAPAQGFAVIAHVYPVGRQASGSNQRFLLAGPGGSFSPVDLPRPELESDWQVGSAYLLDVTGDGTLDTVFLLVPGTPAFAPSVHRLVVKGKEQFQVDMDVPKPGYGTSLAWRDLDGDGRPELVFTDTLGGSGSAVNLRVYQLVKTAAGWNARQLLDTLAAPRPEFFYSYLGKGFVEVVSTQPPGKWQYVAYRVTTGAEDAALRRDFGEGPREAWVDPYSGYDLWDLDGDGTVEIVGQSLLGGLAHPDIIGLWTPVWQCRAGTLQPGAAALYRLGRLGWVWVAPGE
ncbi:MAG: VCBS repeat-containing protein [Bacillota bacterium]